MRIAGLVVGVLGSVAAFIGAVVALATFRRNWWGFGSRGCRNSDDGCIRGDRSLNCGPSRRSAIYG